MLLNLISSRFQGACMPHAWDKKNNAVFALLILGGLSLCIAGVWVPPLLVPGGVFLTGAFGMWASAYVRMYPWEAKMEADASETPGTRASIEHPNVDNVNHPNVTNVTIDDHHIEFHAHYDMIVRPSHPTPEQQEIHRSRSAAQLTYI